MKSVSNLSHAKAVHAVKSIGKVLLPVALLLAAILCIGVAAGAADKTYTQIPGTDMHVETDGSNMELKACDFKGAACATVWKCVCGNTKAHTPDETKHVAAYIVSKEYVKGNIDKCLNNSTLYKSCKNCGKTLTDTFKPADVTIVKNEGHSFTVSKKDAKYLVADHKCNTLVTYYKSCACGVSSEGITNETFTDETAVWPHNPAHYNGEKDADFKAKGWTLKVADLQANVSACNGNGTYYDYCKDCGVVLKDSTSEYTGGTGHTWVVYKNADLHWKACKYCGTTDGTFEAHVYDVNAKPTCKAAVSCSVCGYAVKPAAAHTLEAVAAKAATCNTDGNIAYNKCTVCGKLFKEDGETEIKAGAEVVKATGHKMTAGAPLCNPGKCENCGDTIAPLKAHTYAKTASNYIVDADGNVTDKLLCTAVCSECGAKADAKGHNYETKIVNLPTCTKDGLTIVVCSKCGDIKESRKVLALGHKLDAVVNCYQSAKCNVCGITVSGQHTMPEALRIAIEGGSFKCTDSYKCTVCGIELVGHNQHVIETVAAVAATCTTDGITSGWRCTDKVVINGLEFECTMHYGAEKIEKNGHTWGEWKVTAEATCMSAGKKVRTCTVCGATEEVAIDKLDATKAESHKLSAGYKTSEEKHWQYCTVPGCTYVTEPAAHEYGDNAVTCTKNGVCMVCGYTVKATGHPAAKIVWKNDRTKHWKECSVCGTKISGTEAAHSITIFKNRLEVNYCKDGYEEHYACECGFAPDKVVIPADHDNHKWGAWKYASKANSTTNSGNAKNSYAYRKCDVCGKIDSHKCALKAGSQTCLEDGVCKICGLKLIDKNGNPTKKATDHKFGALENVDGHTFTATCSQCGLIVKTIKHSIEGPACQDRKCTFDGCDYVVKASSDHVPNTQVEAVKTPSGHGFTCATCGEQIANEPHKADPVADCTEDLVCKICGYVMAEGKDQHEWVLVEGVPATCTAEGKTSHFKCKNCTVETTYDVIAKTEHTWVEKEGKPATTTETGYTPYKECSVCGEKVGYQEIPKLAVARGDMNGDGKVNKDDAIYLLKAKLLGTTAYPINQSGDVNGDGAFDKNDAIYLLKNVLLGNAKYPLK